jgi:hypothetical protein
MVRQQRLVAPLQVPAASDRYSLSNSEGPASRTSVAGKYIFGKADYVVGNLPSSPVVGDFNGDGILDVAVVSSEDRTISILLGKPDGTFGSASQITFKSNLGVT